MSWTCHGRSQADMVDRLESSGILQTPRIVEAMKQVDRAAFLDPSGLQPGQTALTLQQAEQWSDRPLYIGYGVTISAPHMHATCLELLEPFLKPGSKVLDVGSGSGYLTGVFALLVGPAPGKAVGVEHIGELVQRSRSALESLPCTAVLLRSGVLEVIEADGRLGYAPEAPYDAIHVGAAADPLPQQLLDQLKPGGRLVVPVGPRDGIQSLEVIDKDAEGRLHRTAAMGVRYVPLTSRQSQLSCSRR